jgi:ABC-2 type transport system permease protein
VSAAFRETVRFELAYYLKRISTWIYFGIFFAISFLLVNAAGGAWESVNLAVAGSGGNVYLNSPYVTAGLVVTVSLFGVIVTAALLGNSVYRDYETGIHPLFFTSPITRFSYLGGRFTGALLVNAITFLSIPLGLLLGSVMPYLDTERFGPVSMMAYLQPYLLFVLPNLLFTGAIFFALAAITRQMLPNYVGGVVLLVGYALSGTLAQDLENRRIAAFLDPFGGEAFDNVTKYWTPAEKNTLLVPLEGLVLGNRLLWVGVGLAIFALVYMRFRFSYVAPERTSRKKQLAGAAADRPAYAAPGRLQLPPVTPQYGFNAQLQQFVSIARRSFWNIVGNRYFYAIVAAGLLFLVLSADQVGKLYGTTTWPVTYSVLEVLGGTFALFMTIIVTFYAGELVWREREHKLHQVVDATPAPNWVAFLGKLTALALVVTVLQAVILVAGVITQAAKGYYNFEIGLYLRSLFGLQLVNYLLLTVMIMLIHVLVNHKYMGHLIVVLYFVFTLFMGQMGLEHGLYRYRSDAGLVYSDMNGYGPFLEPFFWFKAYWAGWALLFAILTNLFWVRGQETGAAWRARLARLRFRRPAVAGAGLAVALILGLGGFIFYNTNVLNEYTTSHERERAAVEYEKKYKRYEGIAQPRIVGASLSVDIFPEARDVQVRGTYQLRNKTSEAIDSIHVRIPTGIDIRRFDFARPAEMVLEDTDQGYYIYRLASPLMPGDSLQADFDLAFVTRGFENRITNTEIVENGTFFNSSVMPSFGYNPNAELSDDDTRRKYDLKPKERMAPVDDPEARKNNYISRDTDWMDFEATVSTTVDQIALAPGYLQREWTENGRRYFHYNMDAPILGFYAFLSADYAIERDQWKDVAIEVYYHPEHTYNLDRMIDAVKKSLEYYTENFGPYQHRQVRILEFPRYATFAQSFPNTIPYSEAIGFIARVDDEEDVDLPFYITAHEVAHQWWAHQVIGGSVQGSTLLSETLSQYSALMVMEKEYGRDQMQKFLEYELDDYLRGRAFERKKERPLLLNENQQYIHYNKGSVAMYALRDYIGEDRLNAALAAYLDQVKFQEPPYTNSLELYEHLQAATPDSLRYLLEDLFEHITLYDNRTKDAAFTRLPDGRYQVTLNVEAKKVRADSLGNESEVPMNDLIDIGVFAERPKGKKIEGQPLYLRKHRIPAGTQQIRVIVDQEPKRAGIDPYHKLIDRHSDDNTVTVKAGS